MSSFVKAVMMATAASFVFAFGGPATRAAVVSIPAARDNSIMENSPENSCAIGNLYSGETQFALSRRALLYFDVAGAVPAGSTINAAQLSLAILRVGPSAAATDVYRLHALLADWGESSGDTASTCFGGLGFPAANGDATWSHRFWPSTTWGSSGGDFVPTPSSAVAVPVSGTAVWTTGPGIVADVQSWLDAPASNFGWIVIGEEALPMTAREFESREGEPFPTLDVSYTPPALTPPTVPDGRFGAPLSLAKRSASGHDLEISWDTSHCSANPDHHLVYGTRATLPSSLGGVYGIAGSECGLAGSSPFAWFGSPDPAILDPGSRLLWMLVIANDGTSTEGSWGRAKPPQERNGPGTNGSSAVCGIADKSVANLCGQEF